MNIYLIASTGEEIEVRHVFSSSMRESLTGEKTLTASLPKEYHRYVDESARVRYGEDRYDITTVRYSEIGQYPVCELECEHVSYRMNQTFGSDRDISGTASELLAFILTGTGFTGEVSQDSKRYSLHIEGQMYRRNALFKLAALTDTHVIFRGETVFLKPNLSDDVSDNILNDEYISAVTYERSLLDGITSYDLTFLKRPGLAVGDKIAIRYAPLRLNVTGKTVLAIEYDPYDPFTVTLEIGDHVPDIVDDYLKQSEQINSAAKAADKAQTSADSVKDNLSNYVKTNELSASIDTYIDSAAGRASIVASLSGTYVTEDALSGYVEKSALSAEVGAYIDTQAGTAQIVGKLEGTFAKESALEGYVEKTSLSAEVGAYIDTQAGTAKIVNRLEGTFAKEDELGNYVEKTSLSAGIESYIDTKEGTAQIVEKLEGTYAKAADLDGYVKKTSLSAEIGAYIDTQAGTAKIINRLEGTFLKEASLDKYVEKTKLSTEIGQYIDTAAGTAKVVSAASGTYQRKDAMSGYVTTTSLNTSIGQYIDTQAGTAKIVSAVSATYATKSEVTTVTSKIEQSVSVVQADITLSTSYSKNTIGTNVQALLQLVSNANSSSIKLKADKIDFTGFTTFLRASDLGSSGSTSIDGGRILTGTISADRIDTDSLSLNTLYGKSSYKEYVALTTSGTDVFVGGESESSSRTFSNLHLIAKTKVVFGDTSVFSIQVDVKNDAIYFYGDTGKCGTSTNPWTELYAGGNHSNHIVIKDTTISPNTTSTYAKFSLGTSTYPWNAIYAKAIYLNGTALTTGGSMAGKAVTMGGSTSYYIQATTSRQFCPNTSSTSYPFYLGTSSYYWHYAYIGSNTASIGSSSSSKIGFFGTTPIARKTVSSSATVSDLITALKAYGLIA